MSMSEDFPDMGEKGKFWVRLRQLGRSAPQESVDFGRRADILDGVMDHIFRLDRAEHIPDDLVNGVVQLLVNDPLSDQQSGCVARYLDLEDSSRRLSQEERERVIVGNWEEIQTIMAVSEERRNLWRQSQKGMLRSNRLSRVYRGMKLSEEQKMAIRRGGLQPAGLAEFGSLETVVAELIKAHVVGLSDNVTGRRGMLERIYWSKANVLRDVWTGGEFGTSSPFKLGISTTTGDNLERRTGRWFGSNYILEISMPENKLVVTSAYGSPLDSEQERTILFSVPAEAIRFHRLREGEGRLWDRMEH